MKHMDKAEPLLIGALKSDDLQQRFFAAAALGWAGKGTADVDRIAAILVPHLKDNRISGDAVIAGGALFRLGKAVAPKLTEALRTATDEQQSDFLRLILRDLQDPPKTDRDFEKRRGSIRAMPDINDPVAGLSTGSVVLDIDSDDMTMTEGVRDKKRAPAAR